MKHIYALINDEVTIDLEGVYGIGIGGLTAVVEDTRIEDYRQLSQEILLQHLVKHQQIIEQLNQHYAVLPIQFGSLLLQDQQVQQMLTARREEFTALFHELQGLTQMELIILWDGAAVFDEIAMELDIPSINASLNGKPLAEIQAKQAEIGLKVQQSVQQRQEALAQLLQGALADFACGTVKNPLMDENMAVHIGVLLAESDQSRLDQALTHVDQHTNGQYIIRCVGPLPPHSFVKISVASPPLDRIQQARQLLGIGETTTAKEIQKAYHHQARQAHPDQQKTAQTTKSMAEITEAYQLLANCAASQNQEVCHLDTATLEQSVILTVQRSGT